MKIYLSTSTAGSYGGMFLGNLKHLGDAIQKELDRANFQSSFEELWLTVSYPPMYVLPGVVGIEKDFEKFYNTFPISRLNRKYKTINVTLKGPEFSEHFHLLEKGNYKHTFDIDIQYKNIPETELAKILLDKYLEAINLIKGKLKSGDIFDYELFKSVLYSLRKNVSVDFLASLDVKTSNQVADETIQRAIDLREVRKLAVKPKNKRIRDLRVYYNNLPDGALYPFDYQYAEIFLNILRKNQLMCPTYHHLYIQVGKTMEDCLRNSFAIEPWYISGLSVIDYEGYSNQNDSEKEKIVFEVIFNGLKDITAIDKLDESIIDKAIEEIKKKGLDTELEYLTVENKKYKLVITYLSRSMEEQCPIYFNLLDKLSGKTKKILIGRAENSQIYLWLQKVTMSNTIIKVKSSTSIAADVYLEGKARTMEFNIENLINE